ncbi:MAG: adenylate/guanylate cyclase domain-containing protein [Casimicrobiaceae bacterium]
MTEAIAILRADTVANLGLRIGEVVERPLAKRPTHATVESIADWLTGPALQAPSGAQVVDEYAWRMLAAGFPLARMTLHSGTLHPQFLGTTFIWWRDDAQTVQTFIMHEVAEAVAYKDNTVLRVTQGGETLRRHIGAPGDEMDLPILRDLQAGGCTDYLALPVTGAQARRYAVTYATDRNGGFSDDEVEVMANVSQRLGLACDAFSQREVTRNLLAAYLGSSVGPKVMAGQIRRGTGEELNVVLWSSDLRGFTARSDRLPGQQMVAILNALFEVQAQAIRNHGGEILKFVGDGLLAIFPIDATATAAVAANHAMNASREALAAVRGLVADPVMAGEPALEIVVALHAGTVIYGNVGAADRLDFTVIGPAVNLLSRVENLAKALDESIVVTDDFARAHGGTLRSIGFHPLRGLAAARELFAPA